MGSLSSPSIPGKCRQISLSIRTRLEELQDVQGGADGAFMGVLHGPAVYLRTESDAVMAVTLPVTLVSSLCLGGL